MRDKQIFLREIPELKTISTIFQLDILMRERKTLYTKLLRMIKENPMSKEYYIKWYRQHTYNIDKIIRNLQS